MRDGRILVESGHVVHGAHEMRQRTAAIGRYRFIIDRGTIGLGGPALAMLIALKCDAHAQLASRFFDATLGEFSTELELARRENKTGVLLVFEMAGCPSCRRMREEVFDRADVRTYFRQRFLIFSVDVLGDVLVRDFHGRELREKDLAKAFKVRGTPTFIFVSVDGATLTRYTGAPRDAEGSWRWDARWPMALIVLKP